MVELYVSETIIQLSRTFHCTHGLTLGHHLCISTQHTTTEAIYFLHDFYQTNGETSLKHLSYQPRS